MTALICSSQYLVTDSSTELPLGPVITQSVNLVRATSELKRLLGAALVLGMSPLTCTWQQIHPHLSALLSFYPRHVLYSSTAGRARTRVQPRAPARHPRPPLHGLDSEASPNKNVFTYATLSDRIILSVSSHCAVIAGALNPLVPVIYGLLVSVFDGFEAGTVEASELRSNVATFSLYYVYLSIALFVFTYVATVGFYYAGDRIARALRTAYLSAILRQDMAFFDTLGPGEIMAGSCRAWVPCRRRLPVNLR